MNDAGRFGPGSLAVSPIRPHEPLACSDIPAACNIGLAVSPTESS